MTAFARAGRRMRGFTLLEVLISIVVIAFGLLGMAGLQAFALKNNQSATYRSIATVLAGDMVDRVRANALGADLGLYNRPDRADYDTSVPSCLSSGCTPEQLATNDRFEWQQLVARSLPGGVGVVCLDGDPQSGATPGAPGCNAGPQYAVKIWWTDDRVTGNAQVGLFTTQFAK